MSIQVVDPPALKTIVVLPQGTYPTGTRTSGTLTPPANASAVRLSFDRALWTDPAVTLTVNLQISLDGGNTFKPHVAFTAQGDSLGFPFSRIELAFTPGAVYRVTAVVVGPLTTSATLVFF